MKKKIIFLCLYLFSFQFLLITPVMAQDKIEVSKQEVSSWFAQNWMWVVGGVVLLLIIAMAGRGGSRRKTTTVVKDDYGNVKSVTTTEIKE